MSTIFLNSFWQATPPYLAGGAPMPRAVYDPMSAASLAASYANIINPGTDDAAPGVAPTHTPGTGWTFNGLTQYLTTGIVPGAGWAAVIRFSGLTYDTGFRAMFGVNSASANRRFLIGVRNNGVGLTGTAYGSGGILYVSPVLTAGVLGVAGQQGYRNGAADGGAIAAWGGSTANGIYIGATNLDGSPASYQACNIQYLAIYDDDTDHATWMPAVQNAVAAL